MIEQLILRILAFAGILLAVAGVGMSFVFPPSTRDRMIWVAILALFLIAAR